MNSAWCGQLGISRIEACGEYHEITFVNGRQDAVELIWIGLDGSQKSYRTLRHDESFRIRTRPGAVWLVRSTTKQPLENEVQPIGCFIVEN
jgi:hypothetical protein